MPIFSVVIDRNGRARVKENIWAATAQDARQRAARHGGVVVKVQPHIVRSWLLFWRIKPFSEAVLRTVAQQTYAVPAHQALAELIRRETTPWKMMMLAPAKAALDAGSSFVSALRALNLFDEATLAIIAAGEKAQELEDAVDQALDQVRGNLARRTATWWFLAGMAGEWGFLYSGVGMIRTFYLPSVVASGIRTNDAELRARFDFGVEAVTKIMDVTHMLMTGAMAITALLLVTRLAYRQQPEHWSARIIRAVPGLRHSIEHDALSLSLGAVARLLRAHEAVGGSVSFAASVSRASTVQAYWRGVENALKVARPERAFGRAPLDENERAQFGHARQMVDVAAACERIGEQRARKAKLTRRRTLLFGLAAFGILVTVAIAGMGWLVSLQVTAGMEAFRRITLRH